MAKQEKTLSEENSGYVVTEKKLIEYLVLWSNNGHGQNAMDFFSLCKF